MNEKNINKRIIDYKIGTRAAVTMLTIALALALVGCTAVPASDTLADELPPVDEQQITNVVEDYFSRQSGAIPEYEAEVEAIEDNWARVSIHPVGVDETSQPVLFYLQNQLESDQALPTPTVMVSPLQTAPRTTDTGWAIIAGPQATFTSDELDEAGVPENIRP